jgi:hypothetical protein
MLVDNEVEESHATIENSFSNLAENASTSVDVATCGFPFFLFGH